MNLFKRSQVSILVLAALLSTGCNKEVVESESTQDTVADSIESGINGVSGVADDLSGENFSMRSQPRYSNIAYNIYDLLLTEAFASNCARAVASSCVGSVKSALYSSCSILGSAYSLSGNVDLTYSSSGVCSGGLSSSGDSVSRTFDYTITGPRGGQIRVYSSSKTDYRGQAISGGGQITKTAAGHNLEILGRNAIGTGPLGRTLFDISVRTTSPVEVTGTLSRNNRTINGGAVEVNHNLAQFTAVHVPNNVSWSSSCCYPVSGSITSSFSGSIGGTATTTFNGCGQVQIEKDGATRQVELSYCE